jgi:hypothetical protein
MLVVWGVLWCFGRNGPFVGLARPFPLPILGYLQQLAKEALGNRDLSAF